MNGMLLFGASSISCVCVCVAIERVSESKVLTAVESFIF